MPGPQRVTIEKIIEAYKTTGSVWNAAKVLGIGGQSVWERLKAVDYPMRSRAWTKEEYAELADLASKLPIGKIAHILGRPYYGVAIKMSRLGLATRFGNRMKRKIPRGSGVTKQSTTKMVSELADYSGSLKQFCKSKHMNIDTVVRAIQTYDLAFWTSYSQSRNDISEKDCPYCEAKFYPMTTLQKHCTRKCSGDAKRDESYFGGNRRKTIGLAEGVCQLCMQVKPKALSSHHILGKQNDPGNEFLIALCPGCHQLVGSLAGRKFADSTEGWENLIILVMGRRMAEKQVGFVGVHAYVEIEHLSVEDLENDSFGPVEGFHVTATIYGGSYDSK